MKQPLRRVKALVFDVFGTVVDWRGSLIAEGRRLGRAKRIDVDWAAFADAWRAGYRPAMDRVRSGALGWTPIDALHRAILDELLERFAIRGLSEAEIDHLNRVWHRLKPWPDARAGLRRLKRDVIIATLSNGNVALLTNMAKFAGLPWDCILSAELFHHYKPDPETYLGAARLLGCAPQEVMMVAAHKDDLRAARACGLRTGFVVRPLERGPGVRVDRRAEKDFDIKRLRAARSLPRRPHMADIRILNPDTLGKPLGQYSHMTRVKASEFLFIAGMLSAGADGKIVGEGDFDAQCSQVFANISAALASAGAGWGNVVQFTTYLVHSQDIARFMTWRLREFPRMFPDEKYPPNTLLIVDRLVQEPFLVEVQTVAAL